MLYHDEIHGDLFTQVDRSLDLLLTKYLRAWISYEGVQRMETYPVPEAALREAVINAIVHKDYASAIPIQISVYDDKLMIWNAGQLPPDWTLEQLTAKHASVPYNPDIASVFFRASLLESWGRGIDLIRDACIAHGSPMPEFRWDNGLWMEFAFMAVAEFQEEAPVVTPPVGPPVDVLVRLLGHAGALGNAEIRARLGLKDRTHLRERYLDPAMAENVVEPTIPDKPSSRLQRYRLTDKGFARLAELNREGTQSNDSEGLKYGTIGTEKKYS